MVTSRHFPAHAVAAYGNPEPRADHLETPLIHYTHDSCSTEWLREMLAMESEAALEPLGAGPLGADDSLPDAALSAALAAVRDCACGREPATVSSTPRDSHRPARAEFSPEAA